MRERLDVRELLHATVPVAVAILVLALAPVWEPRIADLSPTSFAPLVVLILLAAVAGLYVPIARRTLSLGAMVLPVAILTVSRALPFGRQAWTTTMERATALVHILAFMKDRSRFQGPRKPRLRPE